ncbi:MAG: sigma-70 family RNA polymerase sigma factor [Saprospiraceae bacterium]
MEPTATMHPYLNAVRSGDRALLRQLRDELYPFVRGLVLKNSGTEDDAKDVFQDAVMVVYDKAGQAEFMLTSRFSTFFCGIALNLWRSRRKKKSNSEVTIPEDAPYTDDEQPDLDFEQIERQALFDKAMAQLGADCRKLLGLFFQKKTMSEIAENMGFGSENYARRRKHACKEFLIERIRSYPEYRELRNT